MRTSVLTPALLALSATIAAAMGCFYLLISAVPAHAASLGGDVAAGLSTGILMATTICGEVWAAWLLARLSRRKVLAGALALLALPSIGTFMDSLTMVLASCAVRGLGLGVVLVAAGGMAALVAPPHRQAEALGVFGVASAVPAIVCVPVGPWALAQFGAAPIAIVATLFGMAALGGLALLPADPTRETHAHTSGPLAAAAVWPSTALVAGAAAVGATLTFLPLSHRAAGSAAIFVALLVQGAAAAFSRWAVGPLVDRRGPQKAIGIGVVLAALALECLASAGSTAMYAGMALSGIAFGVLQSATLAQLLKRFPATHSDFASTIWNVAYDAGLGIGGLGFGALAAATGYASAFIASALGLCVFSASVFLSFERRSVPC